MGLFSLLLAANATYDSPVQLVFLLGLCLLYCAPIIVNARLAASMSLPAHKRKAALAAFFSVIMGGLSWLVMPLLVWPVGMSLLLLAAHAEMLFLYPSAAPGKGSLYYFIVLFLGRLPENALRAGTVEEPKVAEAGPLASA